MLVEPGELFLQLTSLMDELFKAMGLAGKEQKTHFGSSELLESAVVHPTLLRRHGFVLRAKEDNRWCPHLVQPIKRRLLKVKLRVLERRLAQVVIIEGSAELAVAPVAGPLDVPRSRGRSLEAGAANRQGNRE